MARSERVTVTLPAEMLDRIDRLERNRSRFIADAVKRELVRRRGERLALSLQSPHAESNLVAEEGLTQWAQNLPPEDGDLVDTDSGASSPVGRRCRVDRGTGVEAEARGRGPRRARPDRGTRTTRRTTLRCSERFGGSRASALPLVAVVPVTGTAGKGALYPRLAPGGSSGLSKPSTALVDQIRSVDKRRIRRVFGKVSSEELEANRSGARAVSRT